MFTGIVKAIAKVTHVKKLVGMMQISLFLFDELIKNLEIGASVSINGVCLTVVKIENNLVFFDIIDETLKLTNLKHLKSNKKVNVERAACFGDEISGHILSGHIFGTCQIIEIVKSENNCAIHLKYEDLNLIKYLFKKGYIALDGVSLTLVSVDKENKSFTVHLIPETLRATTFLDKEVGDEINVEIDYQTQVIVDTVTALHL